jgi:hypothetical protein
MKHLVLLVNLADECRRVYDRAVVDIGSDLGGYSVLDLCADNIPHQPLRLLQDAIVVSGIYANANERIRKQIAAY